MRRLALVLRLGFFIVYPFCIGSAVHMLGWPLTLFLAMSYYTAVFLDRNYYFSM